MIESLPNNHNMEMLTMAIVIVVLLIVLSFWE